MKIMLNVFLVLIIALTSMVAIAQDDEDAEITWELVSEDPISLWGEAGDWNSTYNEPGAVIYHDGQYHLFVNGYPGFPADNGIGYRVSDDGVNYEWVGEQPLLRSEDMPNDPIAIAASDVLVLEDGTWVLYYFNFNSANWPRIEATIGRATADDPAGPWTADEDPVFVPSDDDDAWDSASVSYASILETEDGFEMFYMGSDRLGNESLGHAVSEDGIEWERDADPVFILDAPGEDDSFVVNQVVFDGERYIYAYKNTRQSIGIATSEDGIEWERSGDGAIMTPSDLDGIQAIGYISFMINDDGEYMLFFEGNTGGRTQVYAAIVDIP